MAEKSLVGVFVRKRVIEPKIIPKTRYGCSMALSYTSKVIKLYTMFKEKDMSIATKILKYDFKFFTLINVITLKTSGKKKPAKVKVKLPIFMPGIKYKTKVISSNNKSVLFFKFNFLYILSPTLNNTKINKTPNRIIEKVILSPFCFSMTNF